MKPVRSADHLRFIRSLPCSVPICRRAFGIEAAHVGSRGMSQKCSDLETIPLCGLHHREQHRLGLKKFAQTYRLDIQAILRDLTRKPTLKIEDGQYVAYLECVDIIRDIYVRYTAGHGYIVGPVSIGPYLAMKEALRFFRETYIEERQKRAGVA